MKKYDAGKHVCCGKEYLCLHRNENLFINETFLKKIMSSAFDKASARYYPDPNALQLREKLANKYKVKPSNIFVGNGSDDVLSNLFMYYRGLCDTLNINKIGYLIYRILGERYKYNICFLNELKNIDDDTLYAIDSPNSITGEVFNHPEPLEMAIKSNANIIWDNAYGEFASDRIPDNIASNLVVTRSFSKYYGLAGLRLGYCIGSENIINSMLSNSTVVSL